jgi:hypothetical protein
MNDLAYLALIAPPGPPQDAIVFMRLFDGFCDSLLSELEACAEPSQDLSNAFTASVDQVFRVWDQYKVANYNAGAQEGLDCAAVAALAAVTALANAKADQVAAETAPMYPLLKYTMRDTARLLSIEPRSFAELKRQKRVKTKQFGGHPMVMHEELIRLRDLDDPTPINLPRAKSTAAKKPVQKVKPLAFPDPK